LLFHPARGLKLRKTKPIRNVRNVKEKQSSWNIASGEAKAFRFGRLGSKSIAVAVDINGECRFCLYADVIGTVASSLHSTMWRS
jgi:hypothetical protein